MTEAAGALVAVNIVIIAAMIRAMWRMNTRMSRIEGKLGIRNGNENGGS